MAKRNASLWVLEEWVGRSLAAWDCTACVYTPGLLSINSCWMFPFWRECAANGGIRYFSLGTWFSGGEETSFCWKSRFRPRLDGGTRRFVDENVGHRPIVLFRWAVKRTEIVDGSQSRDRSLTCRKGKRHLFVIQKTNLQILRKESENKHRCAIKTKS